MKLLGNKYLQAALFIIIGFFIAWLIFSDGEPEAQKSAHQHSEQERDEETEQEQIWTCSMHPQIRQPEPGQCPICGMDLIPLSENKMGETEFSMSEEAVALANIQTSPVQKAVPEKELRLQGKIKPDETELSLITARYSGRLEKLYVDYTGAEVQKGQKLASIYSPELITAQKELLEAKSFKEDNPSLYRAARQKLRLWNLSEEQIEQIEKKEEVMEVIDILAPESGTVTKRSSTLGEYINEGTVLFEIANLNKLWGVFDAYESDLQWINEGDKVTYSVKSLAGREFTSKISFIDPVIDPKTRTADVRINIDNHNKKLKPNMFIKGTVVAELPIEKESLMIPKTAVMWTGKRSVTYVRTSPEDEEPVFEFREITLGEDLGNAYLVFNGLEAGDQVVTHGTFKVDAAAQLAGKKSMMNRPDTTGPAPEIKEQLKTVSFKVYGNCEMCKARIEKAASGVAGVYDPVWSIEEKVFTAKINTAKTSMKEVSKAIAGVGHKTEFHDVKKAVYDELPSCCKYSTGDEK